MAPVPVDFAAGGGAGQGLLAAVPDTLSRAAGGTVAVPGASVGTLAALVTTALVGAALMPGTGAFLGTGTWLGMARELSGTATGVRDVPAPCFLSHSAKTFR